MIVNPTITPDVKVDVSVVIVNYNVHYFLEQCIRSVYAASKELSVEVLVVDNASVDASLSMLQHFQEVQTIANQENVGFAKANNQAIQITKGKYVLLLNPDTLVAEDCFERCFDYAEKNPKAGCLGARMIDGRGLFLPESKRGFPSAWVSFTKMSGLSRLAPQSPRFNGYYLGHLNEFDTNPVDVLPGAFMWLRSSILPAINGGLDEDYFMYGEDIDLSYLIQRAGFENVYFPEATILHYKGESTRKGSWKYVKSFYQAMSIFAGKHIHNSSSGLRLLLLQIAIYTRALLALVINFFRNTAVPFLDTVSLISALVLVKNLWANYYFQDANYYQSSYEAVNVPLYTSLFLLGQLLAGGYDKPFRIPSSVLGGGAGLILVLIAYALLPIEYRTSRAIILIVGLMSTLILQPIIRLLWSLINPEEVRLTAEKQGRDRRLAIVGSVNETNRALRLLGEAGVARSFVGRVSIDSKSSSSNTIGNANQIKDLTAGYGLDELILCLKDVTHAAAILWLQELGSNVEIRTLGDKAQAIVGSPSRNRPGAPYTVGVHYKLLEPSQRRRKRTLDIAVSLVVVSAFPLFMLLTRSSRVVLNAMFVLLGSATWVGYATGGKQEDGLPKLRPSVLPQGGPTKLTSTVDVQRLNELYARNYKVRNDVRQLVEKRALLGRQILAIRKLAPQRWPKQASKLVDYTDPHVA